LRAIIRTNMNIQYISFDMPFGVRHVFFMPRLPELLMQSFLMRGFAAVGDSATIRLAGYCNMDRPNTHHDALEFPNGQIVLVTRLCKRQQATVLQLPASPRVTRESQEQMHASPVA
jgi:hypothetical protein